MHQSIIKESCIFSTVTVNAFIWVPFLTQERVKFSVLFWTFPFPFLPRKSSYALGEVCYCSHFIKDPDPVMNFVWHNSTCCSCGQEWDENITCWTICCLLRFCIANEKLLLKTSVCNANSNSWVGFATLFSVSSFFTFLLLCDFLKHLFFNSILFLICHSTEFSWMEISCNWAISISKHIWTGFI